MGMLNTQDKTFTADCGLVLKVKPIPYMIVANLQTDLTGMPKPPMIEVNQAGRKHREENPNDPDYKQRVKDFRDNRSMALMRATIAMGTEGGDPTQEWLDTWECIIPNPNPINNRIFYIFTMLTNDESQDLMQAVLAMTMPTEEGMSESQARFPNND